MKLQDIDFLIIGATKSATTWLQQSLQQDPNIYMPAPELHYFSRYYDRGDEWYLSNFEGQKDQRLVGEKSNSYMDTEGAAERIRQKLPKAQLIAQLRNPIERAYSDYCMLYRRGEVDRDIARYLDPRSGAGGRFLNGGLYFQQLQAYLDRFPAEQILVVLYEDMKIDASAQLDRVRKFMKMTNDLPLRPLEKKVKDKAEPVINPTLRRLLRPLKPVVAPFRKSASFKKLRSIAAAEVQYAPLSADLRARMSDFYATEIEKLGTIVGRNLDGWLRNGSVQQ
ncbi:sulfotransferase family protein [Sinorhizobium psoraleae]|uniref:Sulfotransferase n=1 Tax=Sinorhizobium psoraleae TaxID=520838 RepID=A0ABT4KRM4_9HYPH|nr:sulfotransferase [Sinorhizobium psoraleae]MCZ4093946.1 sulfotransferase [Sinorhizobium psoraleae]